MRWTLVLLAALGCEPELVKDSGADTDAPDTDTTNTDTDGPEPVGCDAPGTICLAAGVPGTQGMNGPQKANAVYLNQPTSVAFEADGRPILVDYNNNLIRRIEPTNDVVTVAGIGIHGYAEEGDALLSRFENPIDLARCAAGYFVAEEHGARILLVDNFGNLWFVAGFLGGEIGYSGDGGPARDALLSEAKGVACEDDGTLYIADYGNNAVRTVDPYGTISTLAGTADVGFVDGGADTARFDRPHDVVIHDGALYVADWGNHAIRRIDLVSGEVSTVAGTGSYGFSGDGGPATEAQLFSPTGLAFAEDGTMYVADSSNHLIRRVKPDGIIDTVAGTVPVDGVPQPGYGGDGGPALAAHLKSPYGVAVAPDGKVWIADTLNSVFRVLTPPE